MKEHEKKEGHHGEHGKGGHKVGKKEHGFGAKLGHAMHGKTKAEGPHAGIFKK